MQVLESEDGRRRCVHWELPDSGWEDVAQSIDPFLVEAIRAVTAEYAGEAVEWLEINHWPDTGRLMVFPAQDGPYGNRGERVYFELDSGYLENEFRRIADSLPDEEREDAWETLGRTVWRRTGDCLRCGQASRQLAEARKVHRLRLAAFDYCFGEGLFHLSELDEEAAGEMRRVLEKCKQV
jgi:hypothetical protein